MPKTYLTNGTLYREGERLPPDTEIELGKGEAEDLLERDAIREPGEGPGASPSKVEQLEEKIEDLEGKLEDAREETHPLTPMTVAEINALLPEIDDLDRLQAAIRAEEQGMDRSSALSSLQERVDEVAEEEGDEE